MKPPLLRREVSESGGLEILSSLVSDGLKVVYFSLVMGSKIVFPFEPVIVSSESDTDSADFPDLIDEKLSQWVYEFMIDDFDPLINPEDFLGLLIWLYVKYTLPDPSRIEQLADISDKAIDEIPSSELLSDTILDAYLTSPHYRALLQERLDNFLQSSHLSVLDVFNKISEFDPDLSFQEVLLGIVCNPWYLSQITEEAKLVIRSEDAIEIRDYVYKSINSVLNKPIKRPFFGFASSRRTTNHKADKVWIEVPRHPIPRVPSLNTYWTRKASFIYD